MGLDGETSFESVVLAHLDAAYNLAKWLTHGEQDARDVVQEASLRALRGLKNFRGGDGRAWFLTIVRNTSLTMLRGRQRTDEFVETMHEPRDADADPQTILLRSADVEWVRQAIDQLPRDLRTAIVLRELEGLSYKQIATVTASPIGTVMSRLARGRERLAVLLGADVKSEAR